MHYLPLLDIIYYEIYGYWKWLQTFRLSSSSPHRPKNLKIKTATKLYKNNHMCFLSKIYANKEVLKLGIYFDFLYQCARFKNSKLEIHFSSEVQNQYQLNYCIMTYLQNFNEIISLWVLIFHKLTSVYGDSIYYLY